MVAERYGTEHEEFIVEPDAVAILPRLVWHYGEPFADPSAIPTYYVSQMARRHVTVALNGDGGDEAFLGYARYQAMRHLDRLDRLPVAGPDGAWRGCARWRRPASARRLRLAADPRHARSADRAAGAALCRRDRVFRRPRQGGRAMARRCGRSWRVRRSICWRPISPTPTSLVAGANRADFHTYLPDDLMVKVDVASMAHGLETRSPLLDHVLLEWAARIPPEIKMAGGRTKALFKAAMAPYLPAAILRRKKMGFGCPIDQWLRRELKELAYDTLLAPAARERGVMRPDYVKRLLDEHCTYRANHHTRLWALLMLELWFRTWIDGAAASEPTALRHRCRRRRLPGRSARRCAAGC